MKHLRWILMLTVLLLALAVLPGSAAAAPTQGCWGDILYEYDGEGTMYLSGTGDIPGWDGPVYTPWEDLAPEVHTVYIDDGITGLCPRAFFDFTALTTVRLPNTLAVINEDAFFGCVNLTWIFNGDLELALPHSVKRIEYGAFCGCDSLTSLNLGGVETVGECAFLGCETLRQVTFPATLRRIDAMAFGYCYQLRSITFPAGLTALGAGAFDSCYSLLDIRFQGNAPTFGADVFRSDYAAVKANAYYPMGNATWTAAKRQNYGGQLTWLPVDAACVALGTCGENAAWRLDHTGLLTVSGTGAMYDYDTVHYPPWYGFWEQITAVVVEEGITEVGSTAFYKCYHLASISLPQSLTRLGRSAIFDCDRLTTLSLGPNVADVGDSNFTNCDLLTAYRVDPNNQTFTADTQGALYTRDMTLLISVPGGFQGHFTIPYGVREIHDSAFDCYKGLTGVTIPGTVEIIGNSAFSCCFGLRSVVIPGSVKRIEHAAFWCCDNLERVCFLGNAPQFEEDAVFVNVSALVTYPMGDATWTEDKFVHPGSDLTWQAVTVEDPAYAVPGLGEFITLEEALAAYTPQAQCIRLLRDVTVDSVLSKDLCLDLNGHTITGVLDTQGHAVYGMDSTTDGYTCENMGYFSCVNEYVRDLVPVKAWRSSATGTVRRYMTVCTDKGYTFHRFFLGITHMNMKPGKTAFGYRAKFCGDELVRREVDSVGYRIWVNGGQQLSRYQYGFRESLTLRLSGIHVEKYGQTPVNAQVFLTLLDGTVVESGTVSRTLRDMVEAADRGWSGYTAVEKYALLDLAARYPVIQTWNTPNMQNDKL